MSREVVIDAVRKKRCLTLQELVGLPVTTPEMQRPADAERIGDIVRYHQARATCCMAGGDIVLAKDGSTLWLVDGQHRYLAARRLVESFPNASVCVEEVDLSAPGAPSLGELFSLINRAVPVPEYVVNMTLHRRARLAVDALGGALRARFAAFLSASRCPRRPNVNLDHLLDRIAASQPLMESRVPHSEGGLLRYVLYVNDSLAAAAAPAARALADAKAKRLGTPALYLAEDPDALWSRSPERVAEYLRALDAGDVPQLCVAAPHHPNVRRSSICTALRQAVWNSYHGESSGAGKCYVCSRDVTQQNFECGHVVSVAHGGATCVGNLRVVCRACNRSMGAGDLDAFKSSMFQPPTN